MVSALLTLASLSSSVSPYDHRIEYIGRFDERSKVGPKGSWPAVEALVKVKGSGILVTLSETGKDYLQIQVDGEPTRAVELQPGIQTIEVRADRSGLHTFGFIKRTEPVIGTLQFLQFEPVDGHLVPVPHQTRLMQVIGDAVVCGFGIEATGGKEAFQPATESAYLSFASIAARDVSANLQLLGWSGRKIWPDNTISSVYDLNVPTDPTSVCDFRESIPEVILINFGTNDFATSDPDENAWVGAYKDFIGRIRSYYPKSMIYPAIGPMLTDTYPEGAHALTTIRRYLAKLVKDLQEAGDKRIRLIEFDQQQDADGYGAAWHPSVRTNEKMAQRFVEALHQDLKW